MNTSKTIAILHTTTPPNEGRIENLVRSQALALVDQGYTVRILTGDGEAFDPRIEVRRYPIFDLEHPTVRETQRLLDAGETPPEWTQTLTTSTMLLNYGLRDCDLCIVHDLHTRNTHLALTAALETLESPLIAWVHGLAWMDMQTAQTALHPGYPWELLQVSWANSRYVTVTEADAVALIRLEFPTPTVIPVDAEVARLIELIEA